jgi:hypothetical protein
MQAITVKYYPATMTRGSRLVAKCAAGQVSVPYPYGLDFNDMSAYAAKMLCDKLSEASEVWDIRNMVQGTLYNGVDVFVFKDREDWVK